MPIKKTNGNRLALAASLACVLVLAGCADTFLRVSVPMPITEPMPFDRFSRIVLGDFTEKVDPDSFVPQKHIRDFFLNDVATLIRKPIRDLPGISAESPGIKTIGSALLITGKLETAFTNRNIIDESFSKYGDRIRKFRDVQNWNMEMTVEFIDTDTGKVISRFSTKRELKEAKNPDMNFNYIKLYNQVTDRFVGKLMDQERLQDRFLLTE